MVSGSKYRRRAVRLRGGYERARDGAAAAPVMRSFRRVWREGRDFSSGSLARVGGGAGEFFRDAGAPLFGRPSTRRCPRWRSLSGERIVRRRIAVRAAGEFLGV